MVKPKSYNVDLIVTNAIFNLRNVFRVELVLVMNGKGNLSVHARRTLKGSHAKKIVSWRFLNYSKK